MKDRERFFLSLLIIAVLILAIRALYERSHPLILHGKNARLVAVPSTGRDINSPVSYLFGRAPFFIVCDRAKGTYKAIPNKYMDSPHAAGLKASRMIAGMNVDAVCANNIGFEPTRIFQSKNIEVYTNIKGTVWQTVQAFPDALMKIDKQNVPAHFGITGSKKPIACSSFDAQANIAQVVQGKFLICFDCGYRVSEAALSGKALSMCPICGKNMHEVITVTSSAQAVGVRPKVKVF